MKTAGGGVESRPFWSLAEWGAGCRDLPPGDLKAAAVGVGRRRQLANPPGSLGRLEDVVVWLAQWQGRSMPRLDRVDILVFAGNHGVTAQGVSAYPPEVTAPMVANFFAGGPPVHQPAHPVGANLHVVPRPHHPRRRRRPRRARRRAPVGGAGAARGGARSVVRWGGRGGGRGWGGGGGGAAAAAGAGGGGGGWGGGGGPRGGGRGGGGDRE